MDIIVNFILRILGTLIFFLPGVLLSYVIFKKKNLIERTAYSIVLAVSVATILGMALAKLGIFTPFFIIVGVSVINIILLIIVVIQSRNTEFKTGKMDTSFRLICLFSLIGLLWRLYFVSKVNQWGDGITSHIEHLIGNSIRGSGSALISTPNLNFYTGMVRDRANFIGGILSKNILNQLSFNHSIMNIILSVFLLCSFTYVVIKLFTENEKLALFGAAVMAIGLVEIWQNTFGFIGGNLSYVALISLFIFYKKENKAYFWFLLLIAIIMMFSYYTGSLVMIITSVGFAFALILKNVRFNGSIFRIFLKSLIQRKVIAYLFIALLLSSFIFLFSSETVSVYTSENVRAVASEIKSGEESEKISIPEPTRPYKSKIRFLGLPIISWQNIFFIFLGLTFALYFIFRKTDSYDKDIAYASIPVITLALVFLSVNMPERAFSYLAFFGILAAKIPKRVFRIFVVISLIFLVSTTFLVASQRIKFFTNSDGEIKAAKWVSENLNEIILSDERFISLVIQNNYFKVNGFEDNSPYMYPTFYRNDPEEVRMVMRELRAGYFATTKRMRDDYILMLNFPQVPMENGQMYEENFTKVYDNGDVKVYKINQEPCCVQEP
ncbi:hypothetical protein KJA13_03230 [Patescibacteria group bacterium]|nr:hypothetical protein [Patescibacteria group bacterium]